MAQRATGLGVMYRSGVMAICFLGLVGHRRVVERRELRGRRRGRGVAAQLLVDDPDFVDPGVPAVRHLTVGDLDGQYASTHVSTDAAVIYAAARWKFTAAKLIDTFAGAQSRGRRDKLIGNDWA